MKTLQYLTSVLLLLAASIAPVAAQNYTIPRFAIGGGGGVSVAAVFRVAGTIGQPLSSEVSHVRFTLRSGFWPDSVSTSPPFIRLEPLGNGLVRVSWPLAESGYVLYHTPSLPVGWVTLPPPFLTNSDHLSVIRSERAEFFVLRRP